MDFLTGAVRNIEQDLGGIGDPLDGSDHLVDIHRRIGVIVVGRESSKSLYSPTLVTFEDDKGAYDQKDAQGFIKLNALRLRTLGSRNKS